MSTTMPRTSAIPSDLEDPTVGDAIERYSHEYRRPRGIFWSIDRPDDIEKAFATLELGKDDVDLIVCSDA